MEVVVDSSFFTFMDSSYQKVLAYIECQVMVTNEVYMNAQWSIDSRKLLLQVL